MRNLKHSVLLVVFLAAFLAACGKEEEEGVEKVMEPEMLSTTFLQGDYEKVYSQMSKAFRDEVSLNQLQKLGDDFNQGVTEYILQSELPLDGGKRYVWTDETGTKGITAVFDEKDIIQGLQIMPLETHPKEDNQYTKTIFNFPFHDQWYVFWGGTNSLVNYHYEYENQRYAYDFVKMKNGSTYEGDPTMNESYHAFGEDYLAPADGTVVKVENDVKDNEPVGDMNTEQPLGNHVILAHGNKEFSYLAHFKSQSITVEEGDKVKQGDPLGLVGNSGNSSEPHIHFHVADSAKPKTSESMNITFDREDPIIQGDFVE